MNCGVCILVLFLALLCNAEQFLLMHYQPNKQNETLTKTSFPSKIAVINLLCDGSICEKQSMISTF